MGMNCLRIVFRFLRRLKDALRGYYPEVFGLFMLRQLGRNPKTFQQKIKYKMAHDRSQMLSLWADKVDVRNYVADKIGPSYLIPLVGVYEQPENVVLGDLPDECVIKPSHGSGAVMILSNREGLEKKIAQFNSLDLWKRFEFSKENVTETGLQSVLNFWLKTSYYNDCGHYPEFAYKHVKPRILIEKLLKSGVNIASDYRFFIFNGICEYVEVDQSWNNSPTRDMFDVDWRPVQVQLKFPKAVTPPPRPVEFPKMIALAEKLADGVDHVRVDFYLIDNQIYFGEMTNYHTSGRQVFKPKSFNFEFGRNWHPSIHY